MSTSSRDRSHEPSHASDHRTAAGPWRTALTHVEPNKILVRGYPVDEAMGRLTFGEAIYLLLVGELPSLSIGRLMEALLVATVDHGTTPPSTQATRNVATTGAPLHASVAAGILSFGRYHGGDIEGGMRFLDNGVGLMRRGASCEEAARQIVEEYRARGERLPGFGHRLHTFDPRTARLFQMALELDLEGDHIRLIRTIERILNASRGPDLPRLPINVDGAIAAVCCEIGLPPAVGNAIFIISRVPGLAAQAFEEQQRERPMRQIDSTSVTYDGPIERRLPDRPRA